MNRKGFILIGAGALVAISVPSAYYFFGTFEYDHSISEPKSLALIWDRETIIVIGIKYRKAFDEDGERTLVRSIMNGHAGNQSVDDFIDQKIKQDFQTGNTVTVDGWILSVTEAHQCALSAIAK